MSREANIELIEQLYAAFASEDSAGMAACYHPKARFSDPAFGELEGDEIGAMWAMLIERGNGEIDVTFGGIDATDDTGSADWEAKYTFSQTGRPVHNRVHAEFRFSDGLIVEHIDTFDMKAWLGMALGGVAGAPGLWPLFAKVVRKKVLAALAEYRSS